MFATRRIIRIGCDGSDGGGLVLNTPRLIDLLSALPSALLSDAGFSAVAWVKKLVFGGVTSGTGGRLATKVAIGLAAVSDGGAAFASGVGVDAAPGAGANQ